MIENESQEMYLETILTLSNEIETVRALDVSNRLNFAKSSVSVGLKKLVNQGLITIDHKTGSILLTPEGKEKAETVYNRHLIITKFLVLLKVDPLSAETNACRLEHILTEDVFLAIQKFVSDNTNIE